MKTKVIRQKNGRQTVKQQNGSQKNRKPVPRDGKLLTNVS